MNSSMISGMHGSVMGMVRSVSGYFETQDIMGGFVGGHCGHGLCSAGALCGKIIIQCLDISDETKASMAPLSCLAPFRTAL